MRRSLSIIRASFNTLEAYKASFIDKPLWNHVVWPPLQDLLRPDLLHPPPIAHHHGHQRTDRQALEEGDGFRGRARGSME